MEAIRNYLETMFLNLPNTAEVLRAKNELWQMMEDKYTELKAEGKSENEAVGIVIAEFGNLDELAKDLGIDQVMQQQSAQPAGRPLPLDDAKKYLSDHTKHAFFVALGVFLCIVSVCAPIIASAIAEQPQANDYLFDAMGACVMFVLIACAVGLFIYSGVAIGRWNYLKVERHVTDYATTDYLHHVFDSYKSTYALLLTSGVILCILSVIPPIIFDAIDWDNAFLSDFSAAMLFIFVGVGVFLIVFGSIKLGSIKRLLNLNRQGTVGANYTPSQQNEPHYSDRTTAAVMSVFWPTVTCLYLIWSFLSFDWWITWIIWPIAAIIHALVKNLMSE